MPSPGGIVVGPRHPGGGVNFIDPVTGAHIQEEGFEINIPQELVQGNTRYTFRGTNAQVLDQILRTGGLSLANKVTHVRYGDIVICIRSAWDDTIHTRTGTIEGILNDINTSKGCKPIKNRMRSGGKAKIPLKERLKASQIENPHSPRWKKKKARLEELSNNSHRLRVNVSRDMSSEDERIVLTALVVAIMDKTAERVGNDDSADKGHFGVTGFRKKHVDVIGKKVLLNYRGKSGMDQEKSFSDERIARALKKAIKNSPGKFIFETKDGFRIKSDKVNRYLQDFNITAKDLRGYNANKWIIEKLKKEPSLRVERSNLADEKAKKERKKIFNKALKQVALRVGHGRGTLKKHYMIPELPLEYIENGKIIDMKNIGYHTDGGKIKNNFVNSKNIKMKHDKKNKSIGEMASEYIANWKSYMPRYLVEYDEGFETLTDYNRAVLSAQKEDEASIIDIKTMRNEFYEKGKRMEEGGKAGEKDANGCFNSYLKENHPDLCRKIETKNINETPPLRIQMDEAYQMWNGGTFNTDKSEKIKQVEKELENIQDRIIARKPLTERQARMAEIGFHYDRHTAAKQIIRKGINR